MQHDDSEDEFGFWEPAGRRRVPRRGAESHAAGPVGTHDAGDGEPTRQLQRIDPGQASLHTGELRRLRVSVVADSSPQRAGRRFGRIPAAKLPAAHRADHRPVDEDWYLDGDLTDEHYFTASTLDDGSGSFDAGAHDVPATVPVVSVGDGRRGSWRDRLARDERGRFDPFVTRLGAIALVGVLAIPFALATGSSSGTPNGSTVATRPANVAVIDGARSTTVTPTGEPVLAAPPAAVGADASNTAASVTVSLGAAQTVAPTAAGPATSATSAVTPDPPTSAPPIAAAPLPDSALTIAASSNRTKAIADDAIEARPAGTDITPTSSTPACGPSYTIAAGDYWIGIAGRADVTLAELLHANAAAPTTALYPGRTICLPAGTAALPPAVRVTTTTTAPAATTPAATTPAATTPAATTPVATTPVTRPATTTARTTPSTSPPATTVATRSYSRAEVEQIIRDTWPDDQEDKAVAIATRESNLNPGVRNYCCYGLFQIYYETHRSWLNQMGVTSAEQLFDPAVNALAALVLYNRSGGWGPWAL